MLRHLLKAEHGLKIAVIENEFSDAGIDSQLLGAEPVQVMTLSNGCVCCTIHTDLTKALYLLLERLDSGEILFDRLVIETTGLADPAPVAQTFFIDEELRERYILDGIITLVDAAHAKPVFLITHDIEEAVFLATDLILLAPNPGQIVERLSLDFGQRYAAGESARAIKSDPRFIETREHVLGKVFSQRQVSA